MTKRLIIYLVGLSLVGRFGLQAGSPGNGSVSKCPSHNTARLKLVNIAEKKNEPAEGGRKGVLSFVNICIGSRLFRLSRQHGAG